MSVTTKSINIVIITGIIITLTLFGVAVSKFGMHASFSDIKGEFTKQDKIVNILDEKYSKGNYLLGNDNNETLILEELIKQLDVVTPRNDMEKTIDILVKENLAKSNIAYLKNYPKTDPLYRTISNTLITFSLLNDKNASLKNNIFIYSNNFKIIFLRVNEDRFSVPFRIMDSILFFDVIKEDSKYKIDFLSPILNCEERANFFKFVGAQNIGYKDKFSFLNEVTNCFDYFNATSTISSKSQIYNIAKDRTFQVPVDYGDEKEFLMMFGLSNNILSDTESYFKLNFPDKKYDWEFVKNNFPDEILKKYLPDDYGFISTYEYSYPRYPSDGTEIKAKQYRDFAVDSLMRLSIAFVNITLNQDGSIQDLKGNILDKKNVYSFLLRDKEGGIIFAPSRYAIKVYFNDDSKLKKIDLLYYFNIDNCHKEGPRIYSLLYAHCNYFLDYKMPNVAIPN